MEQDEIKLAWEKLNEKISASSLANKKTLAYLLGNRRRTAFQKLVSADKFASLFFFLLTIAFSFILLRENNGLMLIKIQVIGMMLIFGVLNFISYRKLVKMNLDESVLVLYRKISSYKKFTIWIYLISYVLVFIFIFSFAFSYPLPYFVKVLIGLATPVCIAIDYWIFHWSSNHMHTLIDTTKELNELNKLE